MRSDETSARKTKQKKNKFNTVVLLDLSGPKGVSNNCSVNISKNCQESVLCSPAKPLFSAYLPSPAWRALSSIGRLIQQLLKCPFSFSQTEIKHSWKVRRKNMTACISWFYYVAQREKRFMAETFVCIWHVVLLSWDVCALAWLIPSFGALRNWDFFLRWLLTVWQGTIARSETEVQVALQFAFIPLSACTLRTCKVLWVK